MESSTAKGRGPQYKIITPVEIVQAHIGRDALLIPMPSRKKRPEMPWKDLQPSAMQKPGYISSLNRGNIGVVLGAKSGGLCSIDIDNDDEVAPFLALNPKLAQSLRTKGERGENIWVRMSGPYPKLTKLDSFKQGPRRTTVEPWGEWRSTGGYTLIYGVHPCGQPYKFVVEAHPVIIEYKEIVWPKHVPAPAVCTQETQEAIPSSTILPSCTQETQDTQETQVTQATQGTNETYEIEGVFVVGLYRSVEDILSISIPSSVHQNHHHLFTLARGVKAVEKHRGSKFTTDELLDAFNQWHKRSAQFLRAGQTRDQYMAEFFNGYRSTKYALGGETVVNAWIQARQNPPPPEANVFETDEMRHVVALCRLLQIQQGQKPFYLSCRTLARLLGHNTHSTAATWLGAITAMGYLQEIKKGTASTGLATEYKYLKL